MEVFTKGAASFFRSLYPRSRLGIQELLGDAYVSGLVKLSQTGLNCEITAGEIKCLLNEAVSHPVCQLIEPRATS